MRKYLGVLLIGLGGILILFAVVVAFVSISNRHIKLSGQSAGYIFGFYIGFLAAPLVIIVPSILIIKAGRRMLISNK